MVADTLDMSEDERTLVHQAAWGEPADFSDRPTPLRIRALVLRRLLLGLPIYPTDGAPQPVPLPVGLVVRGAAIDGVIDLDDAHGAGR